MRAGIGWIQLERNRGLALRIGHAVGGSQRTAQVAVQHAAARIEPRRCLIGFDRTNPIVGASQSESQAGLRLNALRIDANGFPKTDGRLVEVLLIDHFLAVLHQLLHLAGDRMGQ